MTPDLHGWHKVHVLVLGDVMLDRFVYGDVDRISPEAPVPILRQTAVETMLGGAGNVARNIASLGGSATLVGMIGDDEAGRAVERMVVRNERITARLHRAATPTIQKTRFVSHVNQMLRVDIEERAAPDEGLLDQILAAVRDRLGTAQVLVLSDYDKGLLAPRLVAEVIALCRAACVPVIVDPKCRDVTRYRGAAVVTPNSREAEQATGLSCTDDDGAAQAAARLREIGGFDAVVLTRGAVGMTICDGPAGTARHLAATAQEVFDVSGAGDTVVAALALGLGSGLAIADAAHVANVAAGLVVAKAGTAELHLDELEHALFAKSVSSLEDKVQGQDLAAAQARRWQRQGLRVGFTNGCFDLVHPGHVTLLRKARAMCDRLIVGLNSDASVRRLKGPSRPVQSETARALVMSAIGSVDLVVIFEEETPLDLILALQPDVLVKGADYTMENVVGADAVRARGGRVALIDIEAGHSTTRLLSRRELDDAVDAR